MGIAAIAKLLTDGHGIVPGTVSAKIETLKTEFSAEAYPALVGVGYICGPRVSAYMLAGGLLGWFVLIPAIVIFGGDTVLFPATRPISELYAQGGAGIVWSHFIRYVGAGMVAAGGVFSLVKSLPGIAAAITGAFRGMKYPGGAGAGRTERDLNLKAAVGIVAALLVALVVLPVAIGLYLPLELSVTLMVGGAVRGLSDWYNRKKGREGGAGILFCSGLVAHRHPPRPPGRGGPRRQARSVFPPFLRPPRRPWLAPPPGRIRALVRQGAENPRMKRRVVITQWPDFIAETKIHPGVAEKINRQLHTQ